MADPYYIDNTKISYPSKSLVVVFETHLFDYSGSIWIVQWKIDTVVVFWKNFCLDTGTQIPFEKLPISGT